jgi:LacI family transcriptional regulator, gluconate utilization system Gnt-I transcriptional repressor
MSQRQTERTVPVKMSDVARAAGVSLMTVSNAFQQPKKVRAETRERIFAAAAELGYIPNLIAGNLASGRSRVIAAIVPSLRNSNFARMIQGLTDHLEHRGYELLLAVADTPERQLAAVTTFLGRRVDGLLLTGTEHSPEVRSLLEAARIPVVETWNLDGPFIDMAVGFSNYEAARALTELMISRGYQHIGFAGFEPRDLRFRERQRAFQDALSAAGLRNDLLFFGPESLGFSGGRAALDHLRQREPRLQAMICVTDIFAVGALFECMRRGWPVPERFALAGYGDYEIAAEVPPGLTTVRTRGYAIGGVAAELLVEKVETGFVAEATHNVGYELVLRGSL